MPNIAEVQIETRSDVSILIFSTTYCNSIKDRQNCLQSQDNLSFAHQDQRNSCQFYTVHFRINTVTVIEILDMPVWFIFGNTLNCKFIKNLNSMTVTKWTQSSVLSFEALLIPYGTIQHHFLQMNLSVLLNIYGWYHEMPQKACERCFFT